MEVNGRVRDVRDKVRANCLKNGLDAVVWIGGDGKQRRHVRGNRPGADPQRLPLRCGSTTPARR
jgi:hypothetical protein